MMEPEKTMPWPDGYEAVQCPCGQSIKVFWNGGELDERTCPTCGRVLIGRHVTTVVEVYPVGTAYTDLYV